MAQAKNLIPGQSYPVKEGTYVGQKLTVLDNVPVKDGNPNQRKVLVELPNGSTDYVLPKVLDDGTVTPGEAKKRAATRLVDNPDLVDEPLHPVQEIQRKAIVEQQPLTDPMDPRLDAYRPDPKVVDEYISRILPGGLKDTDVLLRYWRKRKNVMLVGDTQSGKTMVVQVIAVLAAREAGLPKPYPVFTLSGSSGVTDFDLFGQPTAYNDPETGEERLVWLDGLVDLAVRVGAILYVDEANMLDDRVLISLNPVTDDRRMFVNRAKAVKVPNAGFMPEVVKAAESLWVVGTYNDGYRGGGSLQEAFSNRFTSIQWDYDDEVEKKLVTSAAVRRAGEALRNAREKHTITTPVGTRALQEMQECAYEFGAAFAVYTLLSMFPVHERDAADFVLAERSIEQLLESEIAERGEG